MEDIKKYLSKIGFDVNHLPEVFNNDDKSYYTIPDLIQGYAEHKKSTAPKFEPQGKYQYAIQLLKEQFRLLQDDLKSMLLVDDEFKLTTKRLSDVIDALNKLSAKPMNYDNWVKECKSLLAIKPHVKIRWKDSDFKK